MLRRERLAIFVILSMGAFCSFAASSASKVDLHRTQTVSVPDFILDIDISPDAKLLAIGIGNHSVRIARIGSKEIVHELSFDIPQTESKFKSVTDLEPISVRFSPDSKILAIGFLGDLHFFEVETWKQKMVLHGPGDHNWIADAVDKAGRPTLKSRTKEEARSEKEIPISSLDEAAKARAKLMQQGDGITRLLSFAFNADGTALIATYCQGNCFFSTVLNGRWTFPTGNDPIRLWNLKTEKLVWESAESGLLENVTFLSGGSQFAGIEHQLGHCVPRIFRSSDGRPVASIASAACTVSPFLLPVQDGAAFITNRPIKHGRPNKLAHQIILYESATGLKVADVVEGLQFADVAIDKWLAAVSWGGKELQIWDLQRKTLISKQKVQVDKRNILLDMIRISLDGQTLVVGNRKLGKLGIYELNKTVRMQDDAHKSNTEDVRSYFQSDAFGSSANFFAGYLQRLSEPPLSSFARNPGDTSYRLSMWSGKHAQFIVVRLVQTAHGAVEVTTIEESASPR